MISIVVQCIVILWLMISIVVHSALSIVVHCNTYDKQICAMHSISMAYDNHSCALHC